MMGLTDFIELAKMNEEANRDYGILRAEYSPFTERYEILIYHKEFKDAAAGHRVTIEARDDNSFRLSFFHKGAEFLTLITMTQYEKEFKEWLNPEMEEVSLNGTAYERGMKAAGHKQADFM